jgi:hypothetical protein
MPTGIHYICIYLSSVLSEIKAGLHGLCVIPVLIYVWVFKVIALNVNYVAFDDIMILGIIPEFENADLAEKWKLLTTLFPEHRLVFSRSVILLLHGFFGKVNLVWPMIIANICWGLCAFVFYRAFTRLRQIGLVFRAGNVALVQYSVF